MMGQLDRGQARLFYAFDLDEAVPRDHLVPRHCHHWSQAAY